MQNNISNPPRQRLTDSFSPQKIWILGAGHFGDLAARRLSRRYADASFLVVDMQEEKLLEIHRAYGLPVHVEDAISFLGKATIEEDIWIVPAVPVHTAFLWLLNRLKQQGKASPLAVPDEVDGQVPNPYRISPGGTLYASFATFRCPDGCNEPDEMCTHTKEPRPGNLFERLGHIRVPPFRVVVLRSHQLAPGVGGYTGAHLGSVLEEVLKEPGRYLIATACRCHGVIDALSWFN